MKNLDQERELIAQAADLAGRKVGFAVERNIPAVLQDIAKQRELFGEDVSADDKDKIDMIIKLSVARPGLGDCIEIGVKAVTWATRIKRKDDAFEGAVLDRANPYLPGMEFEERQAMARRQPAAAAPPTATDDDDAEGAAGWSGGENLQEKNLLEAAREMGVEVFRWCRDHANPNWDRSLEKYDRVGKAWKTSLAEDQLQAARGLEAAEDIGHLCVGKDGLLLERSAAKLFAGGWDVVSFDVVPGGLSVLERKDYSGAPSWTTYTREEVPLKYVNRERFRQNGGIEKLIYPPEWKPL